MTAAAVCAREEGFRFSNDDFRDLYRWLGAYPQSTNGRRRRYFIYRPSWRKAVRMAAGAD